jgi:iron(III) transport system substrate-binding protein
VSRFFRLGHLAAVFLLLAAEVKANEATRVIAYCAQDQVYAEPIFQQFEKQTGVKVMAVYDNEAVKTVGLANRLIAERSHPVCDVFWGNEEMRTRQLAAQNIFRETNAWVAFGYRSRRLVMNTNTSSTVPVVSRLFDLTNSTWRARVALAYPQFGTTATHFHVLRQFWGESAWINWCRGLAANQPILVDGNSEVVKAVARGDAWIGLTDSDDIADGRREGLPVLALPAFEETLLIPNTVAVVRGAPHQAAAQLLFTYLQSRPVIEALIKANALETPGADAVPAGTLQPNWPKVIEDVNRTTIELNHIFLR